MSCTNLADSVRRETDSLLETYMSEHEDVFGFRPTHLTDEQAGSAEWLHNAIGHLDDMPDQ